MKYIAIGIISAVAAALFGGLTYQEVTREHGGRHHVVNIIWLSAVTMIFVANTLCCIFLLSQ